jgi:phosphoglycolate phosphatase-like HAD superfamily hydrolase
MRIAIDIDSTLHHYWDVLSDAALRRFGVELPYDEQLTWGITRLRDEQLRCCVEETHCDAAILAGRPYPGAVETVNRWAQQGHFIHITSHRRQSAHAATERWLEDIGLRFDELYCSFDKITRCTEIGIDLLIDDSPVNLQAALDRGIAAATLLHPWNEDVCETEDVVAARDWAELAAKLEPVLTAPARHVA